MARDIGLVSVHIWHGSPQTSVVPLHRCLNCGRRYRDVQDANSADGVFDGKRPRLADLGLSHGKGAGLSLVGVKEAIADYLYCHGFGEALENRI